MTRAQAWPSRCGVSAEAAGSRLLSGMTLIELLVVVAIIALLNVAAIWVRSRLRRRYVSQQF